MVGTTDGTPTTEVEAPPTVGVTGLEPATFRPPDGRAAKLRHTPRRTVDSLTDPAVVGDPPADEAERAWLKEAVAMSRSWRDVLRRMDLSASNGRAGRILRQQCLEWGIDFSHFRSRRWRDADLAPVIQSSPTWAAAMQTLGYGGDSGSARHTLRAHCARLGIDTSHLDEHPRSRADPPEVQVYDPAEIDDLAIVDGALGVYLIPYSRVAGRSTINLTRHPDSLLGRFALAPTLI